jgi:3-deoxy-D-manno-octulosonic-acid transferase
MNLRGTIVFLYYAGVALLLCFVGPFLLLAEKRRKGLAAKLGSIPDDVRQSLQNSKPKIWIHAVSVGEFNAAWPLIQALREQHPEYHLCISTATATGQQLAKEKAGGTATVFYFPLDLPHAINAWLDAVKPCLVAIVETELWPGFTYECEKRSIPMVIVNGRISLRSSKKYRQWKAFFGPVIRRFKAIAAQTEAEVDRYKGIAGKDINASSFGNMKFDGFNPISAEQAEQLRASLGLRKDEHVLIAGSTHEGEEAAMLAALTSLGNFRLIIAPRHPERWDHVAEVVASAGFRPRRFSKGEGFDEAKDVYLLDSIGQLFNYYSIATLAFVGGTLAKVGGHSLAEPYAYGVPVICGPHLFKTSDIAKCLRDAEAIRIITDEAELPAAISTLLQSSELRTRMGSNGREWVTNSQGAVRRTVRMIESVLTNSTASYADQRNGALQR